MISIVIASYNQEEYLKDAIESALNQTVKADEIIIVNDGSTDNSLELARKYPVKIIEQVNKGLASARNTGIMNTNSDYILFLDADDILQENCIEVMQQTIQETGADIVAPSFKCFGLHQDTVILMPNPTIEDFKAANRIGYFSAIRRTKLLEIGGYSPRMTWGWEDLHIWFNLLLRGARLVTIPQTLVLYRTKHESMWLDSRKHSNELWSQIKKDFPTL
jgi:glycosyltransferase involved in cell wall biosynthesis